MTGLPPPKHGRQAEAQALLRVLLVLLFALPGLAGPAVAGTEVAGPEVFEARVTRVLDGDTVQVDRGGERVLLRLEGIDCPENGQPGSNRARQLTSELVEGGPVVVRVVTTDRYRRLVSRVEAGGRDVSRELVRAGLAWHFKRYNQEADLAGLEVEARQARRGLWADPAAVAPWDWRDGRRADAAPAGSGPYRGNVNSRVFHRAGCANFDCKNCLAEFATRDEAMEAGYRPAGCCGP